MNHLEYSLMEPLGNITSEMLKKALSQHLLLSPFPRKGYKNLKCDL